MFKKHFNKAKCHQNATKKLPKQINDKITEKDENIPIIVNNPITN